MACIPLICGPTACGKTSLVTEIFGARGFSAISADSMQIYQHMSIGTAAPTAAELEQLPHYLVNFIAPDQPYSVGDFYRDACKIIEDSIESNNNLLLVGGTGLYIKSLLNGFFNGPPRDEALRDRLRAQESEQPGALFTLLKESDSLAADKLHPADTMRIIRAIEVKQLTGESIVTLQERETVPPPFQFKIAGIIRDRAELGERISKRIELMLANGFIDEVKKLRELGYTPDLAAMKGLGYSLCFDYLDGKISYEDFFDTFVHDTRVFAKRQITLFKKLPGIVWFHGSDRAGLEEYFFKQ